MTAEKIQIAVMKNKKFVEEIKKDKEKIEHRIKVVGDTNGEDSKSEIFREIPPVTSRMIKSVAEIKCDRQATDLSAH